MVKDMSAGRSNALGERVPYAHTGLGVSGFSGLPRFVRRESRLRDPVCALLLALGPSGTAAALSPQGASPSDERADVLAAWEARRHTAVPEDGGWQVRNRGQRWRTRFDLRGDRRAAAASCVGFTETPYEVA